VAITDIKSLKQHLRMAIHVEHSTIPLYLYAYYSIKSPISDAAQSIRGIAMQEMLHLSLASNILTAVGGHPQFDRPNFIPSYPEPLKHHNPLLMLNLERASNDLIRNVFLNIEHPRSPQDVPQDDNYTTIAQFYSAIVLGLEYLVKTLGEAAVFTGDPALQLTDGYEGGYSNATGRLVGVYDLASAKRAVREIIRQGEGTAHSLNDGDGELAHFWLFNQIADGTNPLGEVYPVQTNPKVANLPPGKVQDLMQLFNDCYGVLLRLMKAVFVTPNTNADRGWMIASLVPLMYRVLKPLALLLVQSPIPGSSDNAGPSFEFSNTSLSTTIERCQKLATASNCADLAGVAQMLQTMPNVDQILAKANLGEEA
jgi:rubrerythrin